MFFLKNNQFYKKYEMTDGEIKLVIDRISGSEYFYRIVSCATDEHIGYCDLRTGHNLSLYYYGNIGYRVFPPFRGHGYAYKACLLLFELARKLNMDYLLITASPENTPSVKTCEKLHGEYVETTDVPSWHPLYSMNEKVKTIYRYDLKQGES
ncbi:MAG: GNAT family N-acetyltransferase [Erysipelotrichaceae bacterium]|nr:GNAT family N-acetyltransferase [Erysipelotrichaceae bacterium]